MEYLLVSDGNARRYDGSERKEWGNKICGLRMDDLTEEQVIQLNDALGMVGVVICERDRYSEVFGEGEPA